MCIDFMCKKWFKNSVFIVLLLLVSVCVFSYTIKVRKPWFDTLSGHRQSSSATALIFARNWYNEGAVNLKFAMLEIPDSIEYTNLSERNHYFSYPPGAILPLYSLAKIFKTEPSLSLLMKFNLLNHFLTAFFLSLTIYIFLSRLKLPAYVSFIFSLIPVFTVLLMPAPMYWFQNTYIFLQAVLFPYVVYVFLEVIRKPLKNKKIIDAVQGIVFFYGVLINWIFIFVGAVVFLKRIVCGEFGRDIKGLIKKSIMFWLPVIITIILLMGQILLVGSSMAPLGNSLAIRTGVSEGGDSSKVTGSFYSYFWKDYISQAYGSASVLMFFICLVLLFVLVFMFIKYDRERKRYDENIIEVLFLIGIFLIPGFIYVYIFREWAAIHDVSALYFVIPMATVPFVLMPVAGYLFMKNDPGVVADRFGAERYAKRLIRFAGAGSAILLLISLGYTVAQHERFRSFFPIPNRSYKTIGEFIGKNTGYNDIVFSAGYSDALFHPQIVYYSNKTIHKISDLNDIFDTTSKSVGDYTINIFFMDKDLVLYENGYWELDQGYGEFYKGIAGLKSIADEVIKENGMYLYKISPEVFREFMGKK